VRVMERFLRKKALDKDTITMGGKVLRKRSNARNSAWKCSEKGEDSGAAGKGESASDAWIRA
jgi:hypothetical protein